MSLSRLSSNNLQRFSVSVDDQFLSVFLRSYLAVLAALLDGAVHLHAARLLHYRRHLRKRVDGQRSGRGHGGNAHR